MASVPAAAPLPTEEMPAVARAAGLRYVHDGRPGIRRERRGRGFSYRSPIGQPLHDAQTLARIRALGIPPAWRDVWICPDPAGHLQATGRDARGRKQYRYHPRWRAARDETKYGRMLAFAAALPTIRAHVSADLARPGLPREKVLATVVRLLDLTRLRVGNKAYAQQNGSYGLTTLLTEHAEASATRLRLHFRGKTGKEQQVTVRDRRLASIVRRCQHLPGQELFHYLDEDGTPHGIDSADVNDYLREITGDDFTAKDFRTWGGTLVAVCTLRQLGPGASQQEARASVTRAIQAAADHLGNTPAICRKSYVHPGVLTAYLNGTLPPVAAALPTTEGLDEEERGVLALLHALEAPV